MAIVYSESDEKGEPIGQLRSVESGAMLGAITLCLFGVESLKFEGLFLNWRWDCHHWWGCSGIFLASAAS